MFFSPYCTTIVFTVMLKQWEAVVKILSIATSVKVNNDVFIISKTQQGLQKWLVPSNQDGSQLKSSLFREKQHLHRDVNHVVEWSFETCNKDVGTENLWNSPA